jgi:hypothetical protein
MARRSLWRRIERWLVGIAMAVIAFALEKAVLRSIRKQGGVTAPPDGKTITSKGKEVDLDRGA